MWKSRPHNRMASKAYCRDSCTTQLSRPDFTGGSCVIPKPFPANLTASSGWYTHMSQLWRDWRWTLRNERRKAQLLSFVTVRSWLCSFKFCWRVPISCWLQFYWPTDSHVTSLLHLGNLFTLPYDDEVIQPESLNPSEILLEFSCWQ
jgi:hypothetical protein